jgi:hypothetical protein
MVGWRFAVLKQYPGRDSYLHIVPTHVSCLISYLFFYFVFLCDSSFFSSQKVTKKDLTKRTYSACGLARTAFCLNGVDC